MEWIPIKKNHISAQRTPFQTVLGLVIKNNWDIQAVDIETALQGEQIDRDIFVIPPPEANCLKGHIWKLDKCI